MTKRTALTHHCREIKNTFSFLNTIILKSETHTKKREVHNMIKIEKNENREYNSGHTKENSTVP